MTPNTPDLDADTTAQSPRTGLTRRQFTTTAAWAAPVVALAVATPLAAASPAPPEPALSISRDNSVTVTGDGETRTLSGYYGGSLTALNLPVGVETGALTYTFVIPAGVVLSYGALPELWTVVSQTASLLVFSGPSLTTSYTTTDLPEITFSGTLETGDVVTISISSAEPGFQVADDEVGLG